MNVSAGDKKGCSYCDKVKKLTVNDRWKWAVGKKVCFGCLTAKRAIRKCKGKVCGKGGCQKKHNPLLHFEESIEFEAAKSNLHKPS